MINPHCKLLVLGGGYADIPLIKAAKKLGFYVITSNLRPDDLGHAYADESYTLDFSDYAAMLKLARELKIDAVCPGCNDFAAFTSAFLASELGLPGQDSMQSTTIIHHKDRYREFAMANGINTPKAYGFTDIQEIKEKIDKLKFPVIIKPVDLTGGKGISVIKEKDKLVAAAQKAFQITRAGRIVIEEYIEGSRHGLSTFLRDGKIVFYFSDNEHYFKNPFLVSAASTPGNVPQLVINKLCSEAERIGSLLDLKTGIFHIQYILSNGEPTIIEICRRPPGDLYILFVELATGVEYSSWLVRSYAGMDCDALTQTEPKGYFTRHCVMSAKAGKVEDIVFKESIKDKIINEFMWWEKGNEIRDEMVEKLGIVFIQFDTKEEMLEKTERMQEIIEVKISQI